MFQFGYTFNELRRRLGRTLVTALGRAAGVGLVIGIIGVAQGLDEAQAKVLAPLSSIGTDILVTRVAGSTATNASATPTPTPSASQQTQQRGFFAGPAGGRFADLNAEDIQALENENKNVLTDLS